jgi:hypothetical protein
MEALGRESRREQSTFVLDRHGRGSNNDRAVLDCLRTLAVPALIHHASDRVIRDGLLEEPEEGSVADRAMSKAYLAVLLATYGPTDLLPDIEAWVRRVGDAGSTDCQAAIRFLKRER